MTSDEFRERVKLRALEASCSVGDDVLGPLEAYYRLLVGWNRRINLTALDLDELPDNAVDRLFIEPLCAAALAPLGCAVLDIASGGGSPAIPFALGSRAADLTMVESRHKKSVFLQEAAREAGFPSAQILAARFETLFDRQDLRGRYDVITLRAVNVSPTLMVAMGKFLKPAHGALFMFGRSGQPMPRPLPGFQPPVAHNLTAGTQLIRVCNA